MDFAPVICRVEHAMTCESESEDDQTEKGIFYELEKLTLKNIGYPKRNPSNVA